MRKRFETEIFLKIVNSPLNYHKFKLNNSLNSINLGTYRETFISRGKIYIDIS